MPSFDRPRIHVDFNEMVSHDLVLLSREDSREDSSGSRVTLSPGLRVYLYDDDHDEHGEPIHLLATGTVEINTHDDWSRHVKWCCRIDAWA